MKILIVDDSKAMRTFLGHLLGELGFGDATYAEDGQQALEILTADNTFDLALVDWDMPRLTGVELVRRLRLRSEFVHLKIMMVTTQNTLARVTSALEAGATDFLMKPVTRETLADKLRVLRVLA